MLRSNPYPGDGSGGKQYRVVPGDVIRVEKLEIDSANGMPEFASEVLAV